MHIKRHDSTVRKILKALQRRTYGGGSYYTILDACKAAKLGALGAAAKRLPRWLLPALTDDERAVLRPDILRIIGLPAAPTEADLARALTNEDQYTVQVVEVGYCSDYSWRDKVQVLARLRAGGYPGTHCRSAAAHCTLVLLPCCFDVHERAR